ncbi:MAG: hypothetical protein AAFS10_24035 [Myxococcota bacterium]
MQQHTCALGAVVLFGVMAMWAGEGWAVDLEERRPPPLKKQPGCTLWEGKAVEGNDPTVEFQVTLCPTDGREVVGQTQWSSLRSGWNVRSVQGRWSGGTLELHDVEMVESKPEPGWRFCLIDRYDFTREGNTMTGSYVSAACSDRARLSLTRVGAVARIQPPPPPVEPPSSPTDDDNDMDRSDAGGLKICGGCVHASGQQRAPVGWGMVVLLVASWMAVRRRSSSRWMVSKKPSSGDTDPCM